MTDDDPLVRCIDAAGQLYGLRLSEVREGTGPSRYRVRDVAGVVHRLAYPRALREKLGLGPPSLAEFECAHPTPVADERVYPGTNAVRASPWCPISRPRHRG